MRPGRGEPHERGSQARPRARQAQDAVGREARTDAAARARGDPPSVGREGRFAGPQAREEAEARAALIAAPVSRRRAPRDEPFVQSLPTDAESILATLER